MEELCAVRQSVLACFKEFLIRYTKGTPHHLVDGVFRCSKRLYHLDLLINKMNQKYSL
ncbi:hypothetical protein SAMN04488032_108207 [Pacificibacter marinus]|uniref:Uncharacterized protein n=1 Tax=Pacificibacter marinus TaxID=658057 RepID=A0A1Y5S3R5_9RHOB|nr:hypothetical protein SAMN04488032_108207 [Pacificibacter marinus]SLN29355.1 hypothetical protein PAM7971_01100 [Pacificibacter marinus]